MKLCFSIFLVVVLFFSFSILKVSANHICTENPATPNYNPIASFGGRCSNPVGGASCTTSGPVGHVTIEVTPRDASGAPTSTHEGVTWSCTGFEITDQTVGNRCFQPRGRYTGTGPANCTITAANGVSRTYSFGTGGTDPSGSGPSGDPSETRNVCAYTRAGQKYCVGGTEGATQQECAVNATCIANNGCQVVSDEECIAPPSAITSTRINDPPATDLGQLIKRVFDFSLTIVGLTVFVMVVYGGFLMLLAGGMPAMDAQGRKIITNAFLGALLLFAAYVILNTINPNLVRQRGALPPLPTQQQLPTPRP